MFFYFAVTSFLYKKLSGWMEESANPIRCQPRDDSRATLCNFCGLAEGS